MQQGLWLRTAFGKHQGFINNGSTVNIYSKIIVVSALSTVRNPQTAFKHYIQHPNCTPGVSALPTRTAVTQLPIVISAVCDAN